ncbi:MULTISPECIES: ABC transporter substrate-binding protein [unclassified Plantibacter]|uniref:ABC transporter substrate-binding protein n=1 Tax=unclassified Plantibacter TaxID=2624265 RepID=UPI003D328069
MVVASVAVIGLLSGCATTTDKTGAGNADVATGGAKFSTADEATAALGTDAKPGVFPRTITHAAGTTELAAKPKRVVVLDTGELDEVLALGVTPVGIPTTDGANPTPAYLADKVKGIETVGKIQELNLEAIAALKPDLILGSQLRADKLYPQLSAIAPTVFSIRPGFPWKENFLLASKALGDEDKAVEILNDYAQKAADLKKDVTGKPTISLLRFMPGKTRLYGNKSFIGVVLHDVGLPRPKDQDFDELAIEISPENVQQADADRIFYSSYGSPDATAEQQVLDGPVWPTLSAVKADKAVAVDDGTWFLGLGPLGAAQVLKDLRKLLVTK